MIARSPDNFKAVDKPEAKLHLLKVEKLDACIRPLFANPVTYNIFNCGSWNMLLQMLQILGHVDANDKSSPIVYSYLDN